jgi:hypothetical protein
VAIDQLRMPRADARPVDAERIDDTGTHVVDRISAAPSNLCSCSTPAGVFRSIVTDACCIDLEVVQRGLRP